MNSAVSVLVNGGRADGLSPLDRGLMYGDGVFRTLRLAAGRPLWWQDQLARLDHDCRRLGFAPPDHDAWEADVEQLASQCPDAVLKLVVTRGPGERGYGPPVATAVTRIAIATPAAEHPPVDASTGVHVRRCHLRLAHQPALAGVKHLNRLENVLARMEWSDPGIREGLLLDEDGWVVSGVSSNLLIVRQGRVTTPRLHRCGVAGVARDRVMRAATCLGLAVEEGDVGLEAVLAADEVWLCNSLIRLWWVASLEARTWAKPRLYFRMIPYLDD